MNSLLVSGSLDYVAPQKDNVLDVISCNTTNGWFLNFDQGTHLGFDDIAIYIRWVENLDNLDWAIFT